VTTDDKDDAQPRPAPDQPPAEDPKPPETPEPPKEPTEPRPGRISTRTRPD
jgi:hypothetical protein